MNIPVTMDPASPFSVLNAVERFEAAQDMPSDAGGWWLWVALIAVLGLLVLGSVALLVGRSVLLRRGRRALDGPAERLGLTEDEAGLAWRVTRQAGLSDPTIVLTSQVAFARGLSGYVESRAFRALPTEQQESILTTAESLREKLGLRTTTPVAAAAAPPADETLEAGGQVAVVHRGRGGDFTGTIREVTERELVIESDGPTVSTEPGESWLVRYPNGGTVWEFDASVLRRERNRFVLNRPSRFRYINRRRFPRVPTERPAQLAGMAGVEAADASDAPQFVPGTVVEIAGPGMRLETDLEARAGQSILAVVQLDAERKLQAVGTVHRVMHNEDGKAVLAIELTGLNHEQIAELVRATNAAQTGAAAPSAEPSDA